MLDKVYADKKRKGDKNRELLVARIEPTTSIQ